MPQNLCACGAPLVAHYHLMEAARTLTREALATRPRTMWRYGEVLPSDGERVTLGEGYTPLLHVKSLGRKYGLENLYLKDESLNPTGTFKARGLAMAVARAAELGLKKLAMPSAGNAGGALAAYAARAGLESYIFMPRDVPVANRAECEAYGAHVTLVEGLITDCARLMAERKEAQGWFDVSTLKEPYRVEGKKTLGYEIFEQLGWRLPDAIVYPTGGGVGLIGMWRAFEEMEEMGWIGPERPKMICVQAAGCAPIVRAFDAGEDTAAPWENAQTIAAGLRVPRALGDFLILDALRSSRGCAVTVEDKAMVEAVRELAAREGVFACPEGAATVAALKSLREREVVKPADTIVLCNTGTGLKYLDVLPLD